MFLARVANRATEESRANACCIRMATSPPSSPTSLKWALMSFSISNQRDGAGYLRDQGPLWRPHRPARKHRPHRSPSTVRRKKSPWEVREHLDRLAAGGGYICSSLWPTFPEDIPLENLCHAGYRGNYRYGRTQTVDRHRRK